MGLLNSVTLDVIIGLIFVYLLLAILCTAANECVSAFTRRRASLLKKGIMQLLGNQPLLGDELPDAFVRKFYQHPLIKSMMHDTNHPAYISARTFSKVVTDLIRRGGPAKPEDAAVQEGSAGLAAGASELPAGDVKRTLVALIEPAYETYEAQAAIEGWFNDAMDRVSGWYKRKTQIWTIVIALLLTVVANADTIQITRRLWVDPVLRGAVIEGAKARAQKPPATISVEYPDDADPTVGTVTRTDNQGSEVSAEERQRLGELIGWRGVVQNNNWKDWGERGLGWALTVLALSMGAPFWFDLLNKFMNVRYAGKSPDESAKTPKK
jgi:hypothetical protein